ncbi:MAG: SiaB family protein kinase [Myxococcales bacterium]|nr:SiaB family protein kinase [Myxococcales bacterium]
MKIEEIHSFSDRLGTQGVVLCFNGPFSHGIVEQLGQALRRHMQDAFARSPLVLDVFGVFVEQAQNIQNYVGKAFAPNDPATHGLSVIAKEGERFVVQSGNRVRNADVASLEQRLSRVTSASRDELKKMYKQQLSATIPAGESAGLGLIAMARVSRDPIVYRVDPLDGDVSYFSLRVTI